MCYPHKVAAAESGNWMEIEEFHLYTIIIHRFLGLAPSFLGRLPFLYFMDLF